MPSVTTELKFTGIPSAEQVSAYVGVSAAVLLALSSKKAPVAKAKKPTSGRSAATSTTRARERDRLTTIVPFVSPIPKRRSRRGMTPPKVRTPR